MVDFLKTREWAATIAELEERAAISTQIEDAKLGPFVPNFEATTEEYFDETADYLRAKARDLYFSIRDIDLRRQLIHARRQETLAYRALQQSGVEEAQKELVKAKRGASWKPWLSAAALAVACVILGAKYFDLYGALAGAVGGFFIGQAVASSAQRQQANEIATAERDLAETEETLREGQLSPDWFTEVEESSGERSLSFDDDSVAANRAWRGE